MTGRARSITAATAASVAILCLNFATATAQPLGSFRWQLQPFCNIVAVNVTQTAGIYTLDGTDDHCGAPQKGSVVGIAFQNPDGTIGFGFTTVLAPGGTAVHVDATISLGSLSGTWRDSAGNNGTFVFTPGAGVPALPARPVSTSGLPAASVTTVQIAPAAVTAAQIATGTITTAQISNAALVALSPRFLQTEAAPGPIDIDASLQFCATSDYTPTSPQVAHFHGWAALRQTGAGTMSFQVAEQFSTDSGSTWQFFDGNNNRATTDTDLQWANASQVSFMNLDAGTSYRFAIQVRRDAGAADAGASRCEVLVTISNRVP